mmetsp:Transcript_25554/g.51678  ORF Transcript_25554/g.51678 Transcript_25554/m.51678 type:complete len:357 (-) Transcript_25554:3487-4557(-)
MGDWYNKTLNASDIDCGAIKKVDSLISDVNVLMSTGWVKRQIQQKLWLPQAYLKYAMEVVRGSGEDVEPDFNRFIMVIGDKHCRNNRLPSASKTRYSRFSRDKATGKPFFRSIIWPLNLGRHYDPVGEYNALVQSGNVTRWDDKKPILIWRGAATGVGYHEKHLLQNNTYCGQRIHAVRKYFRADQTIVDVAFQHPMKVTREGCRDANNHFRDSHKSMEEQLKFKYILSIEGNDVASGLKWQMASNSVVFMPKPMLASFFMEDLLVPFVHYVPVNDDLSDLVDMVEWARENDEKCRWISDQATKYVENVWTSEHAREDMAFIQQELGKAYYYQFENAVKSCVPKVVGVPSISNSFE